MGKDELRKGEAYILDMENGSCSTECLLEPDADRNHSGYDERYAYYRQKSPSSDLSDAGSEGSSRKMQFSLLESENEILPVSAYPSEYWKTLHAFLFLLVGLLISCVALATVHDQQPASIPLPDVVFRYVPQVANGLELSEYIIMMITYPTLVVLLVHQHRSIIFRRVFLLTGLLYFCRGFTIFVTVLPQANLQFPCAARVNDSSYILVAHRALSLLSGLGMSINGKLIYCGDFIYSGHTCSLVMCCLVFAEYTPQDKPLFRICKWCLYLLATAGIALISFSRTHYTIDILIAYVITTTFFRIYHTIAAHALLKVPSDSNHLSQMWWFRFIQYFEQNVPEGKIPLRYSIPANYPKALSKLQDWKFLP